LRLFNLALSLTLAVFILTGADAQAPASDQHHRTIVVADSGSRKPLSFASAVFRDTRKGVIADVDGNLTLKAPFPNQLVTISHVGYQSKRFRPSELPDTVLLASAPEALMEAVVKAKDESDPRAEWIIRQTISHKPVNDPDNLASYSYDSYSKLIADIGKKGAKVSFADTAHRHLFLIESVIAHAFKKPFLRQETVKAQKISGLKNGWMLGLATELQYFSFYPDNFSLLGIQYYNPVSGKYHGDYVFHLVDSLKDEDGSQIWIISFRPRRNKFGMELLKGELHIHEQDFGIVNVIASPLANNTMFNISFRQQYRRVGERWFPAQLNTDIAMTPGQTSDSTGNGGAGGAGGALQIIARSYLQDISLDSIRSARRFGNYRYSVAPEADVQSAGYWESHRAVKLDTLDANTYHYMDSVVRNNPDIRKANFRTEVIGDLVSGQIPIGKINLRINQLINYNRYEGLRLGAGFVTNTRFSPDIRLGVYGGYGFADHSVKYGGLFEWLTGYDREVTYGIRYSQDIELTGSNGFKSTPLINYLTLLAKHADSVQKVEIYRTGRLAKIIRVRVFADYQNRVFTGQYRFLDPVKENIAYKGLHFAEAGAYFSTDFKQGLFKLGNLVINSLDPQPKNFLELELKAGKALDAGSSVSYQKAEARYTWRWSLGRPGKIVSILEGGKVFGHLPYGMLFSNLGTYDPFSVVIPATFQTMRWNEFINDAYAALFLNYETGYLIQRREKYGVSLFFSQNTGIGTLADPQLQTGIPANAMNRLYTEAGFGIHLRTSRRNYGLMAFYRYGNYPLTKTADNFSIRGVFQ
jgi:hypothetical protein